MAFLRWALGFPSPTQGAGSHGFSSETLLPERPRTAAERILALTTSLTVLWTLLHRFLDAPFPGSGAALLLASGGIGWGVRMLLPRRPPMDRTALTLGFYTLAPWLTGFVLGAVVTRDLDVLTGFWTHLAGFVAVAAVGMGLDIRREMRATDSRR